MEINSFSLAILILLGAVFLISVFFVGSPIIRNLSAINQTLSGIKTLPAAPSGGSNPQSTVTGGLEDHPYEIGENYFIRTVTFHATGRLTRVYRDELVLEDAAWIAASGRFSDALKSGDFSEVEPFPDGKKLVIGRGSIVDACTLDTPLPRDQK